MNIDRRSLLKYAALAPFVSAVAPIGRTAEEGANAKADYTLRIRTGLVELSPEHIVSTTLYNGQFPGPLLRFKEGQRVVVDVHNDTDTPELVHWHGQMIPSDVDGAAEEGTPFVPAHGIAADLIRAEAVRLSLLSHPRRGRRRPEPRHLHRSGRPGLHRTATQSGRLRPRGLPRHEGVRANLQPRRRHGDGCAGRRSDRGAATDGEGGGRGSARRKPRASRSATSSSPSTAACSGTASPSA